MRALLLMGCLVLHLSAPSVVDAQEEDDFGFAADTDHNAAATASTCQRLGEGWVLTNPSTGRYFCVLRLNGVLASLTVLNNEVQVFSINGGEESERLRLAWVLLDTFDAEGLGPVSSDTFMLRSSVALLTVTTEGRSVRISVVPVTSPMYRPLRDTATALGARF